MYNEWITKLPKIDLHCHLDGSLPLHTVAELSGREIRMTELRVSEDCQNLEEYLEKFELPVRCICTSKGMEQAGYDFLVEAAKERVAYVEVRFAPLLSVNEEFTCRQVIEALLRGLEKGKQASGISYNVIACAMRHHSEEQNLSMFREAREFLGAGVCAFDLAGNEAAYPMSGYRELFRKAKQWDVPCTIHAGECGSVDNIMEALQCGAKRIGHGIALQGHTAAILRVKEQRVGIELCPTSNLQTKAVSAISEYPLREFLSQGLLVTLNTDNRTVSGTTIEREIELVMQQCSVTQDEIMNMMKTAVEISFASDAEKHHLLSLY